MGEIQNSGQNLFYDPGFFNTGKPLVKALITEGEFLVVNAKLIEDGGVQVTNMDWIFQNIVGVIVGFAVFVWPARDRLKGAKLVVAGSVMLSIQCTWWDALYWVMNFGF